MISRMRIVDAGDTNLLVGKVVSVNKFTDENKKVILQGKKPATARPLMLGITKAHLKQIHSYQLHHSKKQLEY